ncbi:unnamed protein product, partial [Timema podura]|nr:unnamed protein product [Timema podura]
MDKLIIVRLPRRLADGRLFFVPRQQCRLSDELGKICSGDVAIPPHPFLSPRSCLAQRLSVVAKPTARAAPREGYIRLLFSLLMSSDNVSLYLDDESWTITGRDNHDQMSCTEGDLSTERAWPRNG